MIIDPRLPEVSDCLYRLSVKALIIRNGKVLLTIEDEDDFWSLPGGGIDYGEDVYEALIRELSEELGLKLGVLDVYEPIVGVIVGLPIDGVPRANLLFRVRIPDEVDPAGKIGSCQSDWFTPAVIRTLQTSPSMGSSMQLTEIVEQQIVARGKGSER